MSSRSCDPGFCGVRDPGGILRGQKANALGLPGITRAPFFDHLFDSLLCTAVQAIMDGLKGARDKVKSCTDAPRQLGSIKKSVRRAGSQLVI